MESESCYIRQPRASKPVRSGHVGRFPGGCERREGAQGVPRDCGGFRAALWCYVMVIYCNSDVMLRYSAGCINANLVKSFCVHEARESDGSADRIDDTTLETPGYDAGGMMLVV